PGAGKTSLLEALAKHFEGRAAVIEGDLATDNDKRRIEKAGLRAYQINTVGACHLDAAMVHDALKEFPLDDIDLLFIENVGNLVCPAGFDIGEDIKVAIVSVPEGEDKPAKYPKAMKVASAMVITKTDLLPYLTCNVERMERGVREIVPDMPVFRTAATTGEGIDEFLAWIETQAAARKA
ncbi:MAG: hydrogenase nickel incorporation protein HypB, partial [Candidatus Hydrogenedentes bacterium]|nr:hydrogenase nickel incorporation protein HypB [Candidatus Hydrogenedentota bacterium]